jgi:hypothetical protein
MNKGAYRRKFLMTVVCLLALAPSTTAAQDPVTCVTQNANRTFFQLWRLDAGRTGSQWDARLNELRELGFNEIIVQWSTYGNVSFFPDPRAEFETAACLERFIMAAGRQGFRIQLGLQYDPGFWQHIDSSKQITGYLKQRLSFVTQCLDALLAANERADPGGTVVNGWYISDEIDDVHWQTPKKQSALTAYLKALSRHLAQKRGHWPIAISGFSNRALSPDQLAAFWKKLLTETGIDTFLFQDGIGAGKLMPADLPAYLSALARKLKGPESTLGVVVELFEIKTTVPEFQTQSATFERIAHQLQLADTYVTNDIIVFSAPDYLTGNSSVQTLELNRQWRADRAACNVE